MNKDINIKNVIFYSVFFLITIIVLDLFFEPSVYFKFNFLNSFLQKITVSQSIAPKRLFINIWRITKNEYVDETLNNQEWLRWKLRYQKRIKTQEDAEIAINTMLASLNDPYTKFLKSGAYSKQKLIIDSKITGVGLLFDKTDNNIVVNRVLDNSPAKEANIMPGDAIISLNGKSTENSDLSDLISAVESDKTDKVTVVIKRNDKLIEKELKKQEIYIKTMDYRITDDNIGIITISNIMGEKAPEDFREIILKTNDTAGLIIDLRNNYGGILANSIQMADFMQNTDKLISIESRANTKYQIYADGQKIFRDKPVIILINKYTASAAEIFAGILRDNLNAVLIGENSFGKNSIQQVIPLYNGTGLIISTDKYILPNGEDIKAKGLTPTYEIKQNYTATLKNDKQMKKAVELITRLMKKEN